jgi:hypothetical protein
LIVRALRKHIGYCDDDAVLRIETGIRDKCSDATEDEIVYFIEQHAPRFSQMKSLDNPMGMLIRYLPKCFEGESFRLYREEALRRREAEAAQQAELLKQWQKIADDETVPDEDRKWARQFLGQEDRNVIKKC